MKKIPLNIIHFNNYGDFKDQEDITLAASNSDLLKTLHSFEGMQISYAGIDDLISWPNNPEKREFSGRHLSLEIDIQYQIESYKEEYPMMTANSTYYFFIPRTWKLYDKEELVYDEKEYKKYKKSRKISKTLNGSNVTPCRY